MTLHNSNMRGLSVFDHHDVSFEDVDAAYADDGDFRSDFLGRIRRNVYRPLARRALDPYDGWEPIEEQP